GLVIGGRYLASPSALAVRPDGPLDALDTQSGRAAQVRIVFASDGWDDDGFADAVSRWVRARLFGDLWRARLRRARRAALPGAVALPGNEHRALEDEPAPHAGRRRSAGAVVRPPG